MVEAKKEGETLTGVEPQTAKYVDGLPDELEPAVEGGAAVRVRVDRTETRFTNRLDPDPRAGRCSRSTGRRRSHGWLDELRRHPTRRRCATGCAQLPSCWTTGLWPAQAGRSRNLEASLAANRPRALIQMATGSGKTFTAANVCYRLIKFADARRVLFLVDRANLGRQTLKEFQQFTTPDDGRKFTELYNVQHLTLEHDRPGRPGRHHDDPAALLDPPRRGGARPGARGGLALTSCADASRCRSTTTRRSRSRPSTSSSSTSATARSTALWRQVLDYFDAFLIGLTATPTKQTFGFFNQNLVMEYGHEQAVADGVNVDFDVYRIRTEITEQGSTVEAGHRRPSSATARPAQTRWEKLDEDLTYAANAARPRRGRRGPDPHRRSRPSATGSSPRSSPAAPRCRRR